MNHPRNRRLADAETEISTELIFKNNYGQFMDNLWTFVLKKVFKPQTCTPQDRTPTSVFETPNQQSWHSCCRGLSPNRDQ